MTNQEFINQSIAPAQVSEQDTGVPAAVTIAQAILESGWGKHHIGDANNYFGIKASKRDDGTIYYGTIAVGYVEVPTREVLNGVSVMVNALFRKYDSITDSFRDHGWFLRNNSRYGNAFNYTDDSDQFAREIHRAGYATDPTYADVLINIMRSNNLYQYNLNGEVPPPVPASHDWVLVRLGDTGQLVSTIQYLLMEASSVEAFSMGSFDETTDQAVRNFQFAAGLQSDGIVGPKTWEQLIITRRFGDSGAAVQALQELLSIWNIDIGFSILGEFESDTDAAVHAFQAASQLEVDGVVGPNTWKALIATNAAS